MKLYRQGDILIKAVSKVPKGRKKFRKDGVLAEGETTGHMHRVENTVDASVFEIDDKLMVTTEKGIRILHEEHGDINLPAGNYEVVRQREHTKGGVRRVSD